MLTRSTPRARSRSSRASVAVSGLPLRLVAGSSVQLKATVANLPAGVTWSASAGTISHTGLYRAPTRPPKGGVVTITATSTANPAVAGTAATGIRPLTATAAPAVAGRVVAGRKAISRIATGHVGRRAIFELLTMTDELRDVIQRSPTIQDIHNATKDTSFVKLIQNGYDLVAKGLVSMAEVERTVGK